MAVAIEDIERAVASLCLDHHLLPAFDAIKVIAAGRESADTSVAALLLEHVPEGKLLEAIAAELGVAYTDLYAADTGYHVDEDLVRLCDVNLLREHNALPLRGPGGQVCVAMANPRGDQDMVEYLRGKLSARPVVVLAATSQIQQRLLSLDAVFVTGDDGPDPSRADGPPLPTAVEESPVVEWVDNLLRRASAENASDIQFMLQGDGSLLVRFSIDGMWRRQQVPLRRRELEVIGAVMSKASTVDASDRTRPQDGTFSFATAGGREVHVRLNMLPQAYGPTVVLRLLDPANINRKLDEMGFAPTTLEQMRRVMRSPQGAVFVIGPTGSGKTTTLYGLLKELNALERNVLTVEQPIEYRLPFIGQTPIRDDLGEKSLTFAKALRAIMRQAPNVILVGEVRDPETATTAMDAAMTGHLVLTTLHAKSALGTFSRLGELGVEPYLAAETVSLAVNQRLLRVPHECSTLEAPTPSEVAFLQRAGLDVPDRVARLAPSGCGGCNGTGYRGRQAVLEVLEPSAALRTVVAERRSPAEVLTAARAEGYTSILDDAFRHVVEGRTTVAELLRCIDTGSM